MAFKLYLIILIICLNSLSCRLEVISTAVSTLGAFAVGAGVVSFSYLKCQFSECCDDNWIRFNDRKLNQFLDSNLFGQHLAKHAVIKTLRGFYNNKDPRKALVMSFHGLTGSGKNYIANMIANSTYKQGTGSAYVHMYSGTLNFQHKAKVSEYQDKLKEDIIQHTRECGRSLFIFDEIDKMAPGVLDALKPFVDYYENIDKVDYRKNLFIFLSNAGSSSITGLTLKFWAEGRNRKEIVMKDVEPIINKGAFNEHGGFQFSELLRSELVDVFVPFLPLEKEHVQKCVEAELRRRNKKINPVQVREIADDLIYFPDEIELYSKSGCKRIEQKVDLYV